MSTLVDLIEPGPGRVAIQAKDNEELGKGGLFLPIETVRSMHEGKPVQGVVVAIGPEKDDEPDCWFEIDDLIIFSKYSGTEVRRKVPQESDPNAADVLKRAPTREERIIIMKISDVIARIKDPETGASIKVRG